MSIQYDLYETPDIQESGERMDCRAGRHRLLFRIPARTTGDEQKRRARAIYQTEECQFSGKQTV